MTLRSDAFLGRVQERGDHGIREEAERAARVVPALLGARPARIEGATEGSAKWDVGAGLGATADAAGEELTRRVLLPLPVGFGLLFGRTLPA
ncbi:hypothetical protein [Streptomyces sp. 900116325]